MIGSFWIVTSLSWCVWLCPPATSYYSCYRDNFFVTCLLWVFRARAVPTRKNHVKKKDMQYLYLKKDTLGIACPNPQYQEVLSWGTWYWVSCLSRARTSKPPERTFGFGGLIMNKEFKSKCLFFLMVHDLNSFLYLARANRYHEPSLTIVSQKPVLRQLPCFDLKIKPNVL